MKLNIGKLRKPASDAITVSSLSKACKSCLLRLQRWEGSFQPHSGHGCVYCVVMLTYKQRP